MLETTNNLMIVAKMTTTADNTSSPLQGLVAGAAAGAFSKTVTAPIERVKLLLQLTLRHELTTKQNAPSIRQVVRDIYQQEGVLGFWRGNAPAVIQKTGNSALNFMLMDYYKLTIFKLEHIMYTTTTTDTDNIPSSSRSYQVVNSLLSGGLSGATTTTLLYPLEFLRTRLAVDIANKGMRKSQQFRGMQDVIVYTYKTDGLFGIYKGYATSIVYVAMHRLFYLGGFDVLKTELLNYTNKDALTMPERVGIAQSVSLLAATVCYPLDTVRRQLMMQAGKSEKQFTNIRACTRQIYARDGIRGFFRGLGPNLFKTVGGALLLVAYDSLRGVI